MIVLKREVFAWLPRLPKQTAQKRAPPGCLPLKLIFLSASYKRKSNQQQSTDSMQPDKPNYLISENNTALFAEGKAKIYTKYHQKNNQGQTVESEVFYNPVQVFNRDFSILTMQGFINRLKTQKHSKFEEVTIVDALSASGLRTIRYIKQLQGVKTVVANDILPAASKLMKDNFELNELDPAKYRLSLQDANLLLRDAAKTGGFDIIDLDPYGSVVPFLDAAVTSVKQGGLLCITCTDTRVLCGPDLAKCFYFYGSVRAKVQDFNENALRVLLYTISSAASRQCKYIEPLLSLQTDFYVRVFVRVRAGKKECGESGSKIGNIYNCQFCGNYEALPFFKAKNNHFVPQRNLCSSVQCSICQHPLQINGPVWLDQLNDHSFIHELKILLNAETAQFSLVTKKKIHGVLHNILGQGEMAKTPLSFNFDFMCKMVHSTTPGRQTLLSAIKSLGQQNVLTQSYLSPGHYKSSLPVAAIYDIIKAWKMREMKEQKYLSNAKQEYALNILKAPIVFKPDFEHKAEKPDKVPRFISLGKGLGPKGKATKRILQQNEQQGQRVQLIQEEAFVEEGEEKVKSLPSKRSKKE